MNENDYQPRNLITHIFSEYQISQTVRWEHCVTEFAFPNGWGVSIAQGRGNYQTAGNFELLVLRNGDSHYENTVSKTRSDGRPRDRGDVRGYLSPQETVECIEEIMHYAEV